MLSATPHRSIWRILSKYKHVYLMAVIPVIYMFVFNYVPLVGLLIAFRKFSPRYGVVSIFTGQWMGLEYFKQIFSNYYFSRILWNTVRLSLLKTVFYFPMPIIFALFLNEMRTIRFKRVVQTISYFPHFLSWVTVAAMIRMLLSPSVGIINQLRESLGLSAVSYLTKPTSFLATLIISEIWKGVGWGSIIYLAAIAGIDPTLYEAAQLDGAGRFQRIWYVTMPGIAPTMGVMLILRMGTILNAGFEQVFLLYSTPVYSVGDIIDTYIFREGINNVQYSYSTAVGLFKSLIGFVLVVLSNKIAAKFEAGLW